MITLKIILWLMGIGFTSLILLIAGETYAMDNTHPRFTKWWRKHVISDGDLEGLEVPTGEEGAAPEGGAAAPEAAGPAAGVPAAPAMAAAPAM